MNRTWPLAAFAAAAFVAPAALAQQDPLARELLEQSAATIRALKGATYSIERTTPGAELGGAGRVKYLRGSEHPARLSFLFEGQTSIAIEGKRDSKVALEEGQIVTWTRGETQRVIRRVMAPRQEQQSVITRIQPIAFPPPLIDADPYTRELAAKRLDIVGKEAVGGVECTIIKAQIQDNIATTVALGPDLLPRRFELTRDMGPSQKFGQRWEITDFKPAPDLTVKDMAIAVPEGWKLDENLTPPAAPTPPAATTADAFNAAKPPAPSFPKGGPALGLEAPAWELGRLAGGEAVKSESLRGKVVVMGFYGSLFGGSAPAAKALQDLNDKFGAGDEVKVVGVACREKSIDSARSFAQAQNVKFDALVGGDAVAQRFNLRGFPSTVVIGKDGKVAAFFEGVPTEAELAAAVEAAKK